MPQIKILSLDAPQVTERFASVRSPATMEDGALSRAPRKLVRAVGPRTVYASEAGEGARAETDTPLTAYLIKSGSEFFLSRRLLESLVERPPPRSIRCRVLTGRARWERRVEYRLGQ